MLVPVYDIKNCGPRHRFVANGKLVHNSDSINLQNLPARGANAGRIKKSMLAPPGHVVIDCDSSQIEARTLAWLAGQTDLVRAFAAKQDVYKLMASTIYGTPVDNIDTAQRQVGKTTILGCGYGVGAAKLQAFLKQQTGLDVHLAEVQRIVTTYRNTYPRIPDLWRTAERALASLAMGVVQAVDVQGVVRTVPGKGLSLPNGLHIQYPDLRKELHTSPQGETKQRWTYTSKGLPVGIYGGKIVENFTQSIARIIIGEQMLRIAKRYQVVLTVHDSVAVVVPVADADKARAYVEACMSWVPKWATGLPLACESGMGASYGDC